MSREVIDQDQKLKLCSWTVSSWADDSSSVRETGQQKSSESSRRRFSSLLSLSWTDGSLLRLFTALLNSTLAANNPAVRPSPCHSPIIQLMKHRPVIRTPVRTHTSQWGMQLTSISVIHWFQLFTARKMSGRFSVWLQPPINAFTLIEKEKSSQSSYQEPRIRGYLAFILDKLSK